MEQLRKQYRLAQEALDRGRLEQAEAHVRAAGRELDAIVEALSRQAGRDRDAFGCPPLNPRPSLRRHTSRPTVTAGTVAEVQTELQRLMERLRGLTDDVDVKRREVRTCRQWLADQETALSTDERGCLDIRR